MAPVKAAALVAIATALAANPAAPAVIQIDPGILRAASGLGLVPVADALQPTVRVVLPGQPVSDRSIEVLVPEHVTAVRHGGTAAEHLFLPRSGSSDRAVWRSTGQSFEYTRQLPGDVELAFRTTVEDDAVRFRYELANRSAAGYDMIVAVTDPRLTGGFHDVRLERTYVHHADGFELLASEAPARLAMPLDRWLPARVLASFTWPVPGTRVEKRADGITYYNKARAVDLPLVATRSADGRWVVASVSRAAGNVWSNPELTCQHVDPQAALPPHDRVVLEVVLLVVRGTIDDALEHARRQWR